MFGGIRLTFIGVEGGFFFFVVLPPSVFDLLHAATEIPSFPRGFMRENWWALKFYNWTDSQAALQQHLAT